MKKCMGWYSKNVDPNDLERSPLAIIKKISHGPFEIYTS